MAKYQVGDRLYNEEYDSVFRIDRVRTLQPEGKVGYELSAEPNGFQIRRFEGELDRGFKRVKPRQSP